jgi:hypothetical protein
MTNYTELTIYSHKSDILNKVGAIELTDISSEVEFVRLLQKVMSSAGNGTYSVHNDKGLFAKFNLKNNEIQLHELSEYTGALMPCWNHFK